MISQFKKHIMSLAVLAVAVVQIFGMRAGYICECTGQNTIEAKCDTVTCHPEQVGIGAADSRTAHADCGDASGNGLPRDCKDHEHREIRESLVLTGLPPVLAPPLAVFFDLPPALQLPDITALSASHWKIDRSDPPEYGSPPMSQMVARIIVMLV